MKLILKDKDKADTYGVPPNDCDSEAVIADYMKRGWDKDTATKHLTQAIIAGAYEANFPRPGDVMQVRAHKEKSE